jgi:lysophospholipase L1-like esterase
MSSRDFRSHLRPGLYIACGLAYAACAIVSLSNGGLAALAREPKPPQVVRGSPDPAPPRFESEIAAFEKWDRQNAFPKDAILFVGSSSIRLWQTAEVFPDAPVINRGFGGSTIADVNHYFERVVAKYKPRAIIFYAGDNDIAAGKSPQKVFEDFQEFVRLVSERLQKTPIYFISIKPSLARLKMWPEMQKANGLVRELSSKNDQVKFVDIATPMLAGRDAPPMDLFLDDGLHLNDDGYKLWNKALSPVIAELLERK